jgi:hypothetical protein
MPDLKLGWSGRVRKSESFALALKKKPRGLASGLGEEAKN